MSNLLLPFARLQKPLIVGMLTAALAGCAATPGMQKSPPTKIQFVSNAQQISEVVAALEGGDTKRARNLLKPMQKRDPSNADFRTLEMSMKADPAAIFGNQAFTYSVKRGDRMTALSKRFLGDPLKFFLLARYNGLKDAQLVPGQTIRIPGSAPAPVPAVVEPAPVTRAPSTRVPTAAPPRSPPASAAPKANPALAKSLRGRALASLNRGNVAEAVATLRRAQAADPASSVIRRDLERAERLLTSVKARK